MKVVRAAWQRIIPEIMFWEAARRRGYDKTETMIGWKTRKKVEYLLKALRQEAFKTQVVLTEEEVRQFYYNNPDLFSESTELWMQEILVDDLDQATALRQRLDAGEDMDSLVHLTLREGATETSGKLHLHSHEEGLYGAVIRRGLEAEPGQLVGPVETREGFSVFRLMKKIGGQLRPFEAVKERVEATLRYRKEKVVFNILVAALREKYADQVRIFEDALSQVRLPEKSPPSSQNRDA